MKQGYAYLARQTSQTKGALAEPANDVCAALLMGTRATAPPRSRRIWPERAYAPFNTRIRYLAFIATAGAGLAGAARCWQNATGSAWGIEGASCEVSAP